MVREVAEVADLDDDWAVVRGGFGQVLDPLRVRVGVAGNEDAGRLDKAEARSMTGECGRSSGSPRPDFFSRSGARPSLSCPYLVEAGDGIE